MWCSCRFPSRTSWETRFAPGEYSERLFRSSTWSNRAHELLNLYKDSGGPDDGNQELTPSIPAVNLPPSTQGVLNTQSAASIATDLKTGFNSFVQTQLGPLLQKLDFTGKVPFSKALI
jgi:hypothetical protein